jgi:hypothetical protein
MACLICGSRNASEMVFKYDEPDKYELWMGIKKPHREWRRCGLCGLYSQYRNYPLSVLEPIYKSGYRDPGFRSETIAQAFERINAIPTELSENAQRCEWLNDVLPLTEATLLDIGAGIGVFAHAMSKEWQVACIEENIYSIDFINNVLMIPCFPNMHVSACGMYDLVSCVHVLEHISKPVEFLESIKPHCGDYLFVEVPDAKEFQVLPSNHDDFNSCHEWFFTLSTLAALLEKAGFEVMDASRKFYPERSLSRIMVLAQCN